MRKIISVSLWMVFALSLGFFIVGYLALKFALLPPFLPLILGTFLAHWLATIGACVLAFRWSVSSIQRRFWWSMTFSLLALASSYWGLTFVSISSTQEVNGRVRHTFDSRWFFAASIVLAALALGFTLWKRWRSRKVANNSLHATAAAPGS